MRLENVVHSNKNQWRSDLSDTYEPVTWDLKYRNIQLMFADTEERIIIYLNLQQLIYFKTLYFLVTSLNP
jgi:hypothetical protein